MKSILKMIFLVGALQAPVASAEQMTGNDLIKFTRFEKTMYIEGVADAIYIYETSFCISPKVTNGQLRAIVEKFMDANPETWDKPAINIVLWSFKQAFPCTKDHKPATKF